MRHFSMCLSVRGALRDLNKSRAKRSAFNDDTGRPLTRTEAIDALQDELVKGREVIPLNNKCGSPCNQSPHCKGFDYSGAGCPGYPYDEGASL